MRDIVEIEGLPSRSLKRKRPTRMQEALNSSWNFFSNIGCGFLSGGIVTGVLNPYDRALFLSLMHKRPFIHKQNFKNPYHGISQTLIQRSLSTGLYFPLEDYFLRKTESHFSREQNNLRLLIAGNLAGVLNGLVLNPLSYIKYQCWGRNNYSFFSQASLMYKNAGPFVFLRGTLATCLRDGLFGATYSYTRNINEKEKGFKRDVLAAALGTIISSPLNYFRNIQFHKNTLKTCPTMRNIFQRLCYEIRQEKSIIEKLKVIQHRLRIGWGTLRVAIGMGFGSKLYSLCHKEF